MKIRSFAVAALAAFILGAAQASLVPTAPADYATVPLLSDGMKAWKTKTFAEQKSASASANTTARKNTEKDYAANSLPVRISWSGGAAPYAVRVVTSRGGKLFYEGTVSDTHVDLMNLEVGRNYTWTVTSGSDKAEGHFFTEPDAPRAISRDECVIANTRDLGGWATEDGRVVKQGMVYRSESFDYYTPTNPDADPTNPDADFDWTVPKTVLFQRFWNDKAGIKTEIDLREKDDLDDAREEYGFADSVISNAHVIISEDICGITFNEACYYNAFTTANGKKAMLSIITNFANSASYPILFHCRYGKDRTGTLALILNALLGVPEDSLRDDYAFTYYAVAEHKANSNFDSVSTMFTRLNAYSGSTLKDKTAAYLLDIGVTQTQIDAIRANLLEEPESPDEKLDEFAYKDYYFRRSAWGGSWNSDSIYWYKTKTGTTKAFKSTDDPCYPKGADAAVWFYPYGSQNKYAFPAAIGQAATPAPLGRIVTDNTYGNPESEIGFNSLNAVFSNAGHSVTDRTFWEHVNGIGMADVVRFFFDGAANNTYSLTMHPNTEMIFQFLTCYGTTSGALYTSNLSTSSTHASFKSSPAYLKFLPGGDQTVRVTEDGDTHLYSKIGWFTGGDVRSTQTFIFENAFLELTNDNHDNAVLGKLAFDFRLGDYVTTSTALAMLRARGALTINSGSTLKVDAGQKAVGKYKLISSVKSLTCDSSFCANAEISNLAAGTSATVTREGNTLYLTVETAAQPLEPADPDDLVMVEYIENASDAYVDTMIPIQDKLVASVDHAYTGFNEKGSYMLAANGLVAGKSDAREYFASVGSTGSWRVGLGQNSLVTILTSDIPAAVLGHRYLVETSVDGKTVRTSVTDKTAQTVARSKDTGFDAAFKVPDVPKTLTLFALNTSSMQYPALARLYGCQIWTDGGAKLVRDFVPCYQKSKQRYGLLDKVSGAFFASASATGFIGSELPPDEGEGEDEEEGEPYVHEMPSDYEEIEFVAANGAQYVDTGLAAKAGLHADVDLMYTRDTSRCILGAADVVLPAPANAAIKRRYQVGTTFAAASGRTLYLFARNDGGVAADFACARIYGAKLTDGEQVVRDYVPCRKKASGVVGFFERMHGKFCPSVGKKPFFVPLRVGVYGGKGATGAVVSWYQLVDGSMECDLVNLSPALAQDGAVFETLDVVVMPGGSSQNEYESLGADGRKNLKDFIANGGRYYGTCAGSHLVLNDEMNLIGYKTLGAVQLHDRVNVRLNDLGKEALRLSQADWNLGYSRGPLITEGTPVEGSDLKVWATYDDEVEHTNSKGYAMNGRYAILAGTYKSGKMFVTSSHPEFYQETTPIITQGFRWLTGRDDVTLDWYGNDTVSTRPLTVFLNASYDCIHSTIETILKAVHDPRINLIKNDTSTESYKTTGKVIINPTGVLGIEATGTDANKAAIKAFKDRGGLCLFEDDGVSGADMWTIIEGLLSDDRTEKSLAWSNKTQSFTGDQTFEGLDLRVSTTGESQTTFKDGTFSFKPNDKGLGGDWVYCADSLVHRVIIDNARVSAVYGNDRRNSYATATAEGVYSGVGVTYFEIRLGDRNAADGDAVLTFEKGLTLAPKSSITVDARGKAPGSYRIIEAGELTMGASTSFFVRVDEGRYGRLVRTGNAVVLEIDESLGEIDRVDWIASTGSQYIDTGVCMQNKLTLDAEFQLKAALTGYGVLFGAYMKETSGTIYRYYMGYLTKDGVWNTAIETGSNTPVAGLAAATAKTRYHFVATVNGKNVTTTLNGGAAATTDFTASQTAHPYTCYLFAHRSGDKPLGYLPATLYGAKVYTNSTGATSGALARDYVPAYRVRSKEYGLYDRVTGTFTPSASDAFSGAAVPSDPVRLVEDTPVPPEPPPEEPPEEPVVQPSARIEGEVDAQPGAGYAGSTVTVCVTELVTGEYSGDAFRATFTVNGKTYAGEVAPLGTDGGIRVTFAVDATGEHAVVARNAYVGVMELWLEDETHGRTDLASREVTLVQGEIVREAHPWFREVASNLGTDGSWEQIDEMLRVFTPSNAMPEGAAAAIETSFVFAGESEEGDDPLPDGPQGAARVVADGKGGNVLQVYSAVADAKGAMSVGWHDANVAETAGYRFVKGVRYALRFEFDYATGALGGAIRLVCSAKVDEEPAFVKLFEGFAVTAHVGGTTAANKASRAGFFGAADFDSLSGEYAVTRIEAAVGPTVDGEAVEPAAVFETARTTKPIEYPSAPELTGEVGAQTIAFGGVSVPVPRHYTATVTGSAVKLALNDFAKPVIEDSDDDKKAIAVGETTVTLHVGKRIDGLFYRVVTTTALGGEWTPVTEFLPVADFTVDRVKTDSAAFYKIEVSDVADSSTIGEL